MEFNFKKKFGQNFISDINIINSFVNKIDIDKSTLVIEIGPGAGILTSVLAKVAKQVICYEIDTELKNILSNKLQEYNNIEIHWQDFLEANIEEDIKKYEYNKICVVANIPYYITTPIIERIIQTKIDFDSISIMVQKEVGERFLAKAGTKDYGSLTVYLNYYYNVSKLLNVPKTVFTPMPKVDSVVVKFSKKEKIKVKNEELFLKLVRDSFRQKRKTLLNNLSNYNKETIIDFLNNNHISLSVRAEQLTLEQFIKMGEYLDDFK